MECVYPTDVTDPQWEAVARLIPPGKEGGRPREVNMRSLINGIFYLVRTCSPLAPAAENHLGRWRLRGQTR